LFDLQHLPVRIAGYFLTWKDKHPISSGFSKLMLTCRRIAQWTYRKIFSTVRFLLTWPLKRH